MDKAKIKEQQLKYVRVAGPGKAEAIACRAEALGKYVVAARIRAIIKEVWGNA